MTTSSETCDPGCGLNATLRIISGKWKPLILFFLRDGPKRYGELKRLIPGVSDKVLIQQLKDLEADRVLARTDYKEVPPRVDYADRARSQPGRRDHPAVHLGNREHGGNGKHFRQARHFALAGCG